MTARELDKILGRTNVKNLVKTRFKGLKFLLEHKTPCCNYYGVYVPTMLADGRYTDDFLCEIVTLKDGRYLYFNY